MHYITKLFLLTLVCYVSGRIGLFFVVPGEQAAGVWPPAGIGLAAVLVWGYRYWPAIFLAAFATSLHHVDSITLFALFVAVVISLGASIQVYVSARLVKYFIPIPNALEDLQDILKLLLFGGVIGNLMSTSVASLTLYNAGILPAENFVVHWLSWWMGDVMGVMVFTPLCLILMNKSKEYRVTSQRQKTVIISFAIVFIIVAYVFEYTRQREESSKFNHFRDRSLEIAAEFQKEMATYVSVLIANESFFSASSYVSRKEFEIFTNEFLALYPGITGVSWIPKVEGAERGEFVKQIRSQGIKDFNIKRRYGLGDLRESEDAEVYFPIIYSEPYEKNKAVIGLDVYGKDPIGGNSRRTALDGARDTMQPMATARFPIVQAEDQYGFIIYNPVYSKDVSNLSVRERQAAHVGYVNGVFLFKPMMQSIVAQASGLAMDVILYDMTADAKDKRLLFDSRMPDSTKIPEEVHIADHLITIDHMMPVSGRIWQITFVQKTSDVHAENWALRMVLLAELLFVSFFSIFILVVTGRTSAIENARNIAESASIAKSDFLANMSHELRTPLNSIIGLSRILTESKNIPKEEQKIIKTVKGASESLLTIVNDVLDISKVEEGKIVFDNRDFNLRLTMLDLEEQLIPIASKNGLLLNVSLVNFENPYVHGDDIYLTRIMTNIIGNALKYTLEGNVSVRANLEHLDDKVVFSCDIMDTGIGIADDKLDYIFEKFSQAEESTTRNFGGTGLGLNITKKLVEQMGGSIGVTSIKGEGSTFSFEIPLGIASANASEMIRARSEQAVFLKSADTEPTKNLKDARVLIAEDHEFNIMVVRKMLERAGVGAFDFVTNGSDAVEAFIMDDYDMIIMDCHMPVMNGYQATENIRELEEATGCETSIPIIAMTADVMLGARDKCIKSGMNDYIAKPIDETLFGLLFSHYFIVNDTDKLPNGDVQGTPVSGDADNVMLYDLSVLEQYAGDDPQQLTVLVDTFIEKSTLDISAIREQLSNGDADSWYAAIHSLKGAASFVGAAALVELCVEAEEAKDEPKSVHNKCYEDIKQLYDIIINQISEVKA